jgi:hypothetical protein
MAEDGGTATRSWLPAGDPRSAGCGRLGPPAGWLRQADLGILPIPGTSKAAHLEENARASSIELSDEQFAQLDEARRASG